MVLGAVAAAVEWGEGLITVLANGATTFAEADGGTHRYLILNESDKSRALEAMVMLASQPPRSSQWPL